MGSCASKNGHQNAMCLEEIELCAKNLLTILGLSTNVMGVHLIVLWFRHF